MIASTAIIDAMVARLRALTWSAPGSAHAVPLFGLASRFTSGDLDSAIQQLLTAESRVAVVVWSSESWEALDMGTAVAVQRAHTVSVIVSDAVIGSRDAAAFGGDSNPGVLVMKDAVIQALTGRYSELSAPVDVMPVEVLLGVVEQEGGFPGRLACEMTWRVTGGVVLTAEQSGPAA